MLGSFCRAAMAAAVPAGPLPTISRSHVRRILGHSRGDRSVGSIGNGAGRTLHSDVVERRGIEIHTVLSIDIGSSSVRAALYDGLARQIADAAAQVPYRFDVTSDGGVEIDADVLFGHVVQSIDETLARASQSLSLIHI